MGFVELVSVSTVLPAAPTPPTDHAYFLSNLDHMMHDQGYVNTVYYYHPPQINDPQKLVSSLKESLSRVLVHYPVLAGRVRSGGDGRLEVDLNDKGVLFKEAYVHARFDDWEDIKDCPFELELNTEDIIITDYSTAPPLRIQINIFQCGGVALGFCFAHVMSDAWAAADFVMAWSEVHQNIPISNPPHFASTILRARNPPQVAHAIKDYISTEKLVSSARLANYQIPEEAFSYQPIVVRMSARQVDDLVDEVESGPWKYGKASAFEAVTAFTWKVMTEARDLPDSTITEYFHPISCRQRWDPPLPPNYFGNAAHISCLSHKAGDIKKNHISYTAKMIHDGIAQTDTHYLKSAMDWIQIELDKGRDVGVPWDAYPGTSVLSTSFIHFPIYETNFGWGKPFYYSFPIDPKFLGDGVAWLLPAPEGGRSRCWTISMKQEHMKKLFENKLFLAFLPNLDNYERYNK